MAVQKRAKALLRSADPHTAMPERKGNKMISRTENGCPES